MSKQYKCADQCASDLDAALDNMVFHEDDSFKARTCFCCDSLMLHVEQNSSVLRLKTLEKIAHLLRLDTKVVHMSDDLCTVIPDSVVSYYKYHVDDNYSWLHDCVISPNTCYDEKKKGFLVCKKCYNSLKNKHYPSLGIKNGYMIGNTPEIFDLLSAEELSCISLVRDTAHIFTYMGGGAATMRGWHSMVDVDMTQVQRALRGMDHSELGFPDSITVVLEGPMTKQQYKTLKKKANASRRHMLCVLTWLIENNCYYAEHFDSIPDLRDIPTPQILEKVQIVDSIDANIELTEQMSVVFPDETLDHTTGGFQSAEQFKEIIADINKGNTTATLTTRASTYVYANFESNFVKAFPRQFPYGLGGPNQMRANSEGEVTKVDFVKYIQHVNNLSNLNFHTQQFSVLTWNILEKQQMIQRACLRVKPDVALQKKIVDTNYNELADYVSCLDKGKIPAGTKTSDRLFLETVNSITYALPHSNEHAQRNRRRAFSMQLRFGFPFVFFYGCTR